MKKAIYEVSMTFTEPLLGGACNNPEIHSEFIASKAPTVTEGQEETAALPEETMEKALGVFPKDDKGLFYWNYQFRGFFKEQIAALVDIGEVNEVSKWSVKKAVNQLLYITPRRVYLLDDKGRNIKESTSVLSRPLRAETLQGPRVALASSQVLPPGTQLVYTMTLIQAGNAKSKCKLSEPTLLAALEFGSQNGFGQWRTAHYGSFTYKMRLLEVMGTEQETLEPSVQVK